MSRLVFTDDACRELLTHVESGRDPPREVCGVLSGRRGEDDGDAEADSGTDRVTGVHRVDNVSALPRASYELEPAGTMLTIDRIEEAGDDVVGFYHSHPEGPSGPSETDRAQATWPGYVYCIVSFAGASTTGGLRVGDAQVGAWRWTGEAFEPRTVEVADDD